MNLMEALEQADKVMAEAVAAEQVIRVMPRSTERDALLGPAIKARQAASTAYGDAYAAARNAGLFAPRPYTADDDLDAWLDSPAGRGEA